MTGMGSLLLVLGLVLTATNAQETSTSTDAITSVQTNKTTADKSLNTTTGQDSVHKVPGDEGTATLSQTLLGGNASGTPGTSPTVQASPMESSSVTSRATTRLSPTTKTTRLASPSPARPITPKSRPPIPAASATVRAATPGSLTGPIIIIMIIIAVVLLGGICYLTRKKSRSVDLPSRQDEVQIPLNVGDLEEAADTASQNGIASFAHKDADVHVASEAEPGNKTQEQEGGKAEADKPDGEGSSEPPAPSPTPANSVDQLAEGGPSEAAPVAPPVDQAPVEKAPVEQAPTQQKVNELTESNKTSGESPIEHPKETNANNSNNNNFVIAVAGWSLDIPEPPLDSPV